MAASYKIIDHSDYADSFNELHEFGLDVLVGLSEPKKSLPSKYLYDDTGSELFRKITKLPEYYPTNCELEILDHNYGDIAKYMIDQPVNLVELGAGFGRKTKILLERLLDLGLNIRYVPIDISESAMAELVDKCNKISPSLEITGLVTDYFTGLKWLNNLGNSLNFVLFLGSSIGNFTAAKARVFLRNLWSVLNHNDITFIGFDLKKDIELLLSAYNDKQGVTAEFNINLLKRINRELGGNFDTSVFRHFGTYDVFSGGMQSYLVSQEHQSVFIEQISRSFTFTPWEPIQTEYSYKYLIEDIERLASETGYYIEKHFYDDRKFFSDSIWRVHKPESGK